MEKIKSAIGTLSELLALETLEYHNKLLLSGSDKTRSEYKQAALQRTITTMGSFVRTESESYAVSSGNLHYATKDIVTDDQIEEAWGNASFGDKPKRSIIANTLLKYACDYGSGATARSICISLNLLTSGNKLTTLGKQYLFAALSGGLSV